MHEKSAFGLFHLTVSGGIFKLPAVSALPSPLWHPASEGPTHVCLQAPESLPTPQTIWIVQVRLLLLSILEYLGAFLVAAFTYKEENCLEQQGRVKQLSDT